MTFPAACLLVFMATNISARGRNNANLNTLEQPNTSVNSNGTTTSSNNLVAIGQMLDSANRLINQQEIERETIRNQFPGYEPEQFQDTILETKLTSVYCQDGFKEQGFLEFIVNPQNNDRYNPRQMELYLKMHLTMADGTDLNANSCPVENFFKKFFKSVIVTNLSTGEQVTKGITYTSDLFKFLENFYLDEDAYKHERDKRKQELCEVTGRRLRAAANSNARLTARIARDRPQYLRKRIFKIDLSEVDDFFKINHPLFVPIKVRLEFETEMNKLFEVRPTTDVQAGNAQDVVCKYELDNSFSPELVFTMYTMSTRYTLKEKELFQINQLYDFGSYPKIVTDTRQIPAGSQNFNFTITNIPDKPIHLVLNMSSPTSVTHSSVYDNTLEDKAFQLIKKIDVRGLKTSTGVKDIEIETNSDQKHLHKRFLYGSLRNLVNNSPVFAKSSDLRETDYMRNFPTYESFVEKKTGNNGCYPLVINLTESKGTYEDAIDNPNVASSELSIGLVFDNPLNTIYSLQTSIITQGKFVLHTNASKTPQITRI